MKERLQKILAHAGVASRRAAEVLITSGKVRVNGRLVTELGALADSHRDRIEVDGKRVVLEKPVYLILHKPRGVVSTLRDPEGRPDLANIVRDVGARVYPIGRLDFHTSGVLLLTNDGELTDALLSPRRDVPKVYVAKVRGLIPLERLENLRKGVTLDDGHKTKPADIFVLREEGSNTWLQITLYEGKNRQIHRMGDAVGHPVLRLARLSFAGITHEGLKPGQLRPLSRDELDRLKKNYLTPYRRSRSKAQPLDPLAVDSVADDEPSFDEPTPKRSSPRAPSGGRPTGGHARGAARSATSAPTKGTAKRPAKRDAAKPIAGPAKSKPSRAKDPPRRATSDAPPAARSKPKTPSRTNRRNPR